MFAFDPTITPRPPNVVAATFGPTVRTGGRPIAPLRARALDTDPPAEETAIDKADRAVKGIGATVTLFLLALIGVQAVRDRRGRR